ncbi:hypothetical protein K493DRAFT_308665 [Basidiobolus meristosporus CBS 931.73]|uniref:BHLH domain-containing protein n=1 Tax=Basidiobolus meristosporus CBS 931.73 TaxID=1314790 RepID=A0A1Y1WYM6_9FUNG|nr:hypothetical protein K493DRAFT_308665 [Basidiobolus meristosporus CBS 931.73]|eukprot:ORX78650.1 hypothetical protein K493DRAFT_308665 [Basidiobolus meristosporus CBS 931.73]
MDELNHPTSSTIRVLKLVFSPPITPSHRLTLSYPSETNTRNTIASISGISDYGSQELSNSRETEQSGALGVRAMIGPSDTPYSDLSVTSHQPPYHALDPDDTHQIRYSVTHELMDWQSPHLFRSTEPSYFGALELLGSNLEDPTADSLLSFHHTSARTPPHIERPSSAMDQVESHRPTGICISPAFRGCWQLSPPICPKGLARRYSVASETEEALVKAELTTQPIHIQRRASTSSASSSSMAAPCVPHQDSPGKGRGGFGRGKRAKCELLTEKEKRANHIASEQKRRQNIRVGFERLVEIVPTLSHSHRSESVILQKSVEYIHQLLNTRQQLKQRVQNLQWLLGET